MPLGPDDIEASNAQRKDPMPITQDKRPLKVNTPLGKDAIFITSFSAREGISQLFQYYLELIAPNNSDVPFDRLLGQKVTVELATIQDKSRFFNGIVSRIESLHVGPGRQDICQNGLRQLVITHDQ